MRFNVSASKRDVGIHDHDGLGPVFGKDRLDAVVQRVGLSLTAFFASQMEDRAGILCHLGTHDFRCVIGAGVVHNVEAPGAGRIVDAHQRIDAGAQHVCFVPSRQHEGHARRVVPTSGIVIPDAVQADDQELGEGCTCWHHAHQRQKQAEDCQERSSYGAHCRLTSAVRQVSAESRLPGFRGGRIFGGTIAWKTLEDIGTSNCPPSAKSLFLLNRGAPRGSAIPVQNCELLFRVRGPDGCVPKRGSKGKSWVATGDVQSGRVVLTLESSGSPGPFRIRTAISGGVPPRRSIRGAIHILYVLCRSSHDHEIAFAFSFHPFP